MGSFTKSFKASNQVQWTNTYTFPDELKVTGSSFKLSQVRPTIKSYRAWTVSGTWSSQLYGDAGVDITILNKTNWCNASGTGYSVAWANKATKNLPYRVADETIQTSQIFNKNNPTTRQVRVTMKHFGSAFVNDEYYDLSYNGSYSTVTNNLGLITLNVPPTFANDPIAYDTNFDAPYAGLTTASVDVSNITAYYDGYITKATLKIGNQTSELTGSSTSILSSGTLSILLDAVGTFTPTITVTDSRGQTKTVSLEAITVKGYSAPQVSINEVLRTDENGLGNDEGKCAVVTATFTWTSAITDLDEPTLVATELDDALVQTETKWYATYIRTDTDRPLQNEITDWSEVSNMPVYGFIGNTNTPPDPFDTQDSYNITITPNDEQGTGTPVTATLGSAFYTVDFLAGGHGIAFGKPAETQELFECNLNAQFNKDLYLGLDTTEPPDTTTTDGQIYQALKDLGWTDVIV